MAITITLFYAGILGLILIGLSVRVVTLRRRRKVGVGSGEHSDLELAIRAHANFGEYVPMALLLLLLLEASTAVAPLFLHVLGVLLLTGRLLHGYFGLNLSAGTSAGRFYGTLLTWLMLLLTALLCVWVAVGRWIFMAS
ncbi:MAG: MAPEG family protein [Wenzhouxiangella sp.]